MSQRRPRCAGGTARSPSRADRTRGRAPERGPSAQGPGCWSIRELIRWSLSCVRRRCGSASVLSCQPSTTEGEGAGPRSTQVAVRTVTWVRRTYVVHGSLIALRRDGLLRLGSRRSVAPHWLLVRSEQARTQRGVTRRASFDQAWCGCGASRLQVGWCSPAELDRTRHRARSTGCAPRPSTRWGPQILGAPGCRVSLLCSH